MVCAARTDRMALHHHTHGAGHLPQGDARGASAPRRPATLHGHGHGDASFKHRRTGEATTRLGWALFLALSFGAVEAGVGFYANSLALLSDAAHMMTDGAALGLAWAAGRIAQRRPDARYSYGFERAETLAAFVNALSFLVLLAWLLVEAAFRMASPQPILAGPALVVAILGLFVNLGMLALLRHDHGRANTRAALLHVLGDLAASVAAIVAMAFAWWGDVRWVDALMAGAVALLMIPSTIAILRSTIPVLMDAVPRGLDFAAVGAALGAVDGVRSVHDLHVWQMTAERVALSAHVAVESLDAWPATLAAARAVLRERFGIEHATLQPEPARRAADA